MWKYRRNKPLPPQTSLVSTAIEILTNSPSQLYSLKQGLSLNRELTNSARLAGQRVPEIHLSQGQRYRHSLLYLAFVCVLGIRTKALCSCSILSTDPSFQFPISCFFLKTLFLCPRLDRRGCSPLRHCAGMCQAEASVSEHMEFRRGDTPEMANGKDQDVVCIVPSFIFLYSSALVQFLWFMMHPSLCSLILRQIWQILSPDPRLIDWQWLLEYGVNKEPNVMCEVLRKRDL